jgi:aminoglycoside phosphotransferase (APT) family kinase protein
VTVGDGVEVRALTGGVSSDIYLVESEGCRFVVKRALPKLRVADDWQAPVSRNRHEADWLETVGRILPDNVPRVIARDDEHGLFAMEYFDLPVWKTQLRDGVVDLAMAEAVGRCLATIHAATAHNAEIAECFATDDIFHAIRLEPYLETAARRHPAAAEALMTLSARTLATKVALVHGDVSPKNILAGPAGPIFLDAECAWYGDPAFDLAFCLNHLLLKCLWNRGAAPQLLVAFDRLAAAYHATDDVEQRTATLLPGLLLARVDGKSPVEYLGESDREFVREFALRLLAAPVETTAEVASLWAK